MKKRLGIILLFVMLFVAFIVIWNFSYQTGKQEAYVIIQENHLVSSTIPLERRVFERVKYALDYAKMPIDKNHQRTLKTYYKNRAYHGAPPAIPHPVKKDKSIGKNSCLQCHRHGGFVAKFNAYAPVTPHPELISCVQCHVAQRTDALFVPFTYRKIEAPKVGTNKALKDSPPTIPHPLQMHENCLACHAGPGAPKEIRVSHPERVNCRQCHVPNDKEMTDIGVFARNKP